MWACEEERRGRRREGEEGKKGDKEGGRWVFVIMRGEGLRHYINGGGKRGEGEGEVRT